MDVIVTDPDDGRDCLSLNRKIPARVGDNKSQARNVKLSKISQGQECNSLGVSEVLSLNFNSVCPPRRPTDTRLKTLV